MRYNSSWALLVCALFVSACSDSSGPPGGVGPLAMVSIQSGSDLQRALAGTALSAPIVIVPQDDAGRTVPNQTATFSIIAGGGFLSGSTGQANSDGTITAPTWTLGKSDVPQEMRVNIDGRTTTVRASVQTAYVLSVRFYGAPVSPSNQNLFTSASARIRGFIVGGLPPVDAADADVSPCTGTSIPPLNETIQGLLIYASVDSIDGRNKVLAAAGPCYIRGNTDYRTVIGVMKFDSADIESLAASGTLQDVITHEMMHVVGLGTFWEDKGLIVGSGAPGAGYTGQAGVAGCRAIGGTVSCATSVPIEDCVGLSPTTTCGAGTKELHWKETTFGNELMTGYLSAGGMPLSVMSIRSFEDLDYSVNTAAADGYTIAIGSLSAATGMASSPTATRDWERPLPVAPRVVPTALNRGDGAR
ncbi:MAG: leishmanolysin-related zinc metalloendopeptidase [Gemmatimonadaceae bacterium]